VDHRRHQAQYPTGALELHQGGPVGIKPVKDLGVDRIGRLDPFLVVGISAIGREFCLLCPVEVREGSRRHIAMFEQRRVGHGFEQPPPHDLEAFLSAGRPP